MVAGLLGQDLRGTSRFWRKTAELLLKSPFWKPRGVRLFKVCTDWDGLFVGRIQIWVSLIFGLCWTDIVKKAFTHSFILEVRIRIIGLHDILLEKCLSVLDLPENEVGVIYFVEQFSVPHPQNILSQLPLKYLTANLDLGPQLWISFELWIFGEWNFSFRSFFVFANLSLHSRRFEGDGLRWQSTFLLFFQVFDSLGSRLLPNVSNFSARIPRQRNLLIELLFVDFRKTVFFFDKVRLGPILVNVAHQVFACSNFGHRVVIWVDKVRVVPLLFLHEERLFDGWFEGFSRVQLTIHVMFEDFVSHGAREILQCKVCPLQIALVNCGFFELYLAWLQLLSLVNWGRSTLTESASFCSTKFCVSSLLQRLLRDRSKARTFLHLFSNFFERRYLFCFLLCVLIQIIQINNQMLKLI